MTEDAGQRVADLINGIYELLDSIPAVMERESTQLNPRAVTYWRKRLARLTVAVEATGVTGDSCTAIMPQCMGRAAGGACTCDAKRLPNPRVNRLRAAKVAPSRRTSTGRLLVEVPQCS